MRGFQSKVKLQVIGVSLKQFNMQRREQEAKLYRSHPNIITALWVARQELT